MATRRRIAWIILLVLAAIVKIVSLFPTVVEKYYAQGIYPYFSRFQRLLFGWVPFSIGDLLYIFAFGWLVYLVVRLIRRLVRRQAGKAWLLGALRRIVFAILVIYVVFYGLWGLNYDRQGIATQLHLVVTPYSNLELDHLLGNVCDRLNELDSLGGLDTARLGSPRVVFAGAILSYDSLGRRDPRFVYAEPSVKGSLFGVLNDYMGFGGYYNPFTGEAQVNTTLPVLEQPFTACHEIGHQLGYAKENEANLAGYLSARASTDPAFQYSVYSDLYLYAARELYVRDSNMVVPLRNHLRPAVRQHFRQLQRFYRRYQNPFEPVIRRIYGNYLRANRQPQGINTYDEVIASVIAYARKNGWERI